MPVHPHTAKLQWDVDGVGSYTDVADVMAITPPDLTKGDGKTTGLSAANKVHTYLAGWREGGEISCKCYFEKAGFNTLIGYYNSDTVYYWKVLFPLISGESNNSNLAFQGYVKGVKVNEMSVDTDDPVSYEVTIKITGAVTFTSGG